MCAPVGKRASSSISMFPYTSIYYLEAAKAVRLPPAPSIIALQVPQGNPLVAQELNKMLPSGASQDEQDLDQPVQHEQLDGKEQTEQEKQISIKISPLARPYISFGPDIRQHPCAMYTTTPKMYVPLFTSLMYVCSLFCYCSKLPAFSTKEHPNINKRYFLGANGLLCTFLEVHRDNTIVFPPPRPCGIQGPYLWVRMMPGGFLSLLLPVRVHLKMMYTVGP